ncbi:ABC transporter permease [Salipiger sp. PrR002]|uniref:ABC transporter permease n=1 Tax=Salipiger sp. PrR002 TaxID=2706489 RepID=UPI0013B8C528|nr:ABC transporter permease [Salipiger sp. PrR002]NDW01259.1 ABC transporter permease [Salipiger sp. PrR002]NDW58097.1 ABC transporter permease [Salipiger sp. PrR004]
MASIDPLTPAASPKAARPEMPRGMWAQGWSRFRRNRTGMLGLVLVSFVVLVAILSPLIAPYSADDQSAMLNFGSRAAPSLAHPFGTDRMGYDVFTRVVYGAPTALAVGLGTMLVASVLGLLIGGISGYVGGWADEVMMRITEFFLVLPVFVVILAVVRLFGVIVVGTPLEEIPYLNLSTIVVLLGLFGWPPIARIARAEFMRLKSMEFVEAARCIGATRSDILMRHILPNAMPSLVVIIALGIGSAILSEAMVSFLGFGDPEAISWGQLLYFNYENLKVSPWASIAPSAAIFITVLGFNLLADGLSDAFNPRVK